MNSRFFFLRTLVCTFFAVSLLRMSYQCSAAEGTNTIRRHTPVFNWQLRSDWVDVKKAGAVGDGTADDTSAIQRVLDGVKSGSTVYFPAGTYRITKSLMLTGPFIGVRIIGHGWATRLVWDGPDDGKLLIADGSAYSDYYGITLDGKSKASVGIWHHNEHRFETEVRHQHVAFLNFREAGLATDDADHYATAETMYENCLFENCGSGVRIHSFNDYNHTFAGCEFRGCGIGIDCSHGNFYARDCHFEGSTKIDISTNGEHAGSVRRCTSVNSNAFLHAYSTVGPLTVQDCRIERWKSADGAVLLQGAPIVMFDCAFTRPPGASAPIRILDKNLRFISSNNTVVGAKQLIAEGNSGLVYEVPKGKKGSSLRSASQTFLTENVRVPGKVFDAVREFGAKGDGQADDTKAIQATINAARAYGKNSIAYVPFGSYAIFETLVMSGKDYTVGGCGFQSLLVWKGAKDGVMLEVKSPENLRLEAISIGNHDAGPMANAIDILQTSTGKASRMTYDGVYVYGMYQRDPFRKGLVFRNLGSKDVVTLPYVQGNLRFDDCGMATILGNCTYEGSVVVEGKNKARNGFLGMQTRLATVVKHGLYVRDNHSFVASDFYIEQSDSGMDIEGNPGDPSGRVTVQGAKLEIQGSQDPAPVSALDIRNYQGQIFFGHYQFYPGSHSVRVHQVGARPVELFLMGVSFYGTMAELQREDSAQVHSVGNLVQAPPAAYTNDDGDMKTTLPKLSVGLDDLRRLGELDLKLNFPESK